MTVARTGKRFAPSPTAAACSSPRTIAAAGPRATSVAVSSMEPTDPECCSCRHLAQSLGFVIARAFGDHAPTVLQRAGSATAAGTLLVPNRVAVAPRAIGT